ncbi:hypothetical protein C0991_001100 [Blastosporella zonata]|nr:hypothetical protein C0991_001100 [Blastosporella zonata]
MSFLQRRSGPLPSAPYDSVPPIPFPPAVENIHTASQPHRISLVLKGRRTSPGTIIRRVSSLLGKKKTQPAFAPLDIQAPSESQWRPINVDDGSESDVSEFDDIRRPSGLGRSVSISSNRSLPPSPFTTNDEESPFRLATATKLMVYGRSRAVSSPNLLRFPGTPKMNPMPTLAHRNKQCPPPPMPQEVLVAILSFTPRHAIASHARASSDWCNAARTVFYEAIDLRTLRPKQVELLVTLLAYRHDLTDLVRSFECHAWPDFFPPPQSQTTGPREQHPSFSTALTAIFTIAFQNMHFITSLVLPAFDHTFLRHHSAFGLRKLTILSHTMTNTESTQLFAWLDGQINITYLAFPNLLDSQKTPTDLSLSVPKISQTPNTTLTDCSNTYSPSTSPSQSPVSPFSLLTPITPASPFHSLTLLPALTTCVGTPSVITSLVTTIASHIAITRPLQRVTLSLNNTLYTGLRPAALLSPLHGITALVLKFSPAVDRRTIGKVLSAGAVLTTPTKLLSSSSSATESIDSTRSIPKVMLQNLELHISEEGAGADLALYKMISSSISRYQGIISLKCRFASPSPDLVQPPVINDREVAQVAMWAKHCPSLRLVELLSGARWERVEK